MANSLQLRSLSACIGALITLDAAGGDGQERVPQSQPPRHYVTNCDDQGPGSLRDVLATAASGDSVDLTQLACSTIALTSGQLLTNVRDITLEGSVRVSAGGKSRVLAHLGDGMLSIKGLTIEDGSLVKEHIAAGGCVYTRGSVSAIDINIQNCTVSPAISGGQYALGGGIFAYGDAHLIKSTIVGNSIIPKHLHDIARGGGVYTRGNLILEETTISGNYIVDNAPEPEERNAGGGIYSTASVLIVDSTISGNFANFAGGVKSGRADWLGGDEDVSTILNSTVSGNSARIGAGGVVTEDALMRVWNSTIAFNTVEVRRGRGLPSCGGIFGFGPHEYLSFRSSIVANNTVGRNESDVCTTPYTGPIIGYENLIVSSNQPLPSDTIQSNPLLAPLEYNGGRTLTHMLLPSSPAIDAGNNDAWLAYDQRGRFRIVGVQTDIGALEVQPDTIFVDDFD